MGPWLRSHGRRFRLRGASGPEDGASMGPWLRSHGRESWRRMSWQVIGLQWGRGFAATEGRRDPAAGFRAGMLQWGRGFAATEGAVVRVTIVVSAAASMGPWLRSHGRLATSTRGLIADWLQWGRGFAATEGGGGAMSVETFCQLQWGRGFAATEGTASGCSTSTQPATLQWGRGFAATEGASPAPARRSGRSGFNGAVASQPRKDRIKIST